MLSLAQSFFQRMVPSLPMNVGALGDFLEKLDLIFSSYPKTCSDSLSVSFISG
jgi:hypothetical protein